MEPKCHGKCTNYCTAAGSIMALSLNSSAQTSEQALNSSPYFNEATSFQFRFRKNNFAPWSRALSHFSGSSCLHLKPLSERIVAQCFNRTAVDVGIRWEGARAKAGIDQLVLPEMLLSSNVSATKPYAQKSTLLLDSRPIVGV
jgi:hypothetical protein